MDEIIHPWKSVVFHRQLRGLLDFLSELHASREALPTIESPQYASIALFDMRHILLLNDVR